MDRFGPGGPAETGSSRSDAGPAREILTVGQLNRAVAGLLERSLPLVWVSGEISNLTRAASGHWYFTLKDVGAQVRAVMFRGRAQYVDFVPREGDRVEVRALVTLYEARGDFQLNVEAMRRAGSGDLHQRFLQIKAKLQSEGLFEAGRKRRVPRLPGCIGVITSTQAAALRDVLTTLRRRAPQIPVIVYPSSVQGADAPAGLRAALDRACRRAECEVLLLVRGGGSIEDLWAFNDEALARAVADSPIPVIAGVGHETDFTIVDFVADLRAPTPTAAAELATVDRRELLAGLSALVGRAGQSWARVIGQASQQLDLAVAQLRPPSDQWRERAHRVALLAARLQAVQLAGLDRRQARLERLSARLRAPDVALALQSLRSRAARLRLAAGRLTDGHDANLGRLRGALELVSPLSVLERGYSIVRDADGRVLTDAAGLEHGATLRIRLARGELDARLLDARPEASPD